MTSSCTTSQFGWWVMGSSGIWRRYPAVTSSSRDCGAFCLSSVYCEMTLRKVARFERRTDSRACTMDWLYIGTATAIRIMMMLMTIINSRRVNPRELRRPLRRARACDSLRWFQRRFRVASSDLFARRSISSVLWRVFLPVFVFCAVKPGAFGLGVHVEHVLAAPRIGIRIILHGAEAPFLAL